ncbi:uncharacterized protein LOC117495199 isoform X2 [Trematomus bernacchii]|uniref:uncharacterized protein LOC117495199 isoform X2 n=1 Tax=Trematomus bernacchii TaxID=40690 RepID=UPI00146A7B39|nr:uncharacterized protein LOC117495199 isoform X2 [Trematomus bernacchii]
MVPDLVNKYLKMWLWILISLEIITKVHGYSNGKFPESCVSMLPEHRDRNGIPYEPQRTEPPFEITHDLASRGQPITVYLKSKQSNKFTGFMLEARITGTENVVGKFIVLDSQETRLLSCNGLPDNAVSQRFSSEKSVFAVNWMAPAQGENLEYTFRATFLQYFDTFWERVDFVVKLPAPTTTSTTLPIAPTPTTTSNTTPITTTQNTTSTTTPIATTPNTTSTTTPITTTQITTSTTTPIATTPNTTSTTTPITTTQITTSTTTPIATTPTTTSTTTPIATTPTTTSTTTPIATTPNTTSTTTPITTTPTTTITTTQITTSTTTPIATNVTKLQEPATVLMIADSVLVAVKTELPLLITLLINGPRLHHLNKVKILSRVLCAAVEIPALVLFSLADPINGLFIALVCVAIDFNFMELFIVCLRIEPSHELKEISELTIKVCSVIHCIFTTATIFLGVLEFNNCGKEREDSWPVKVMMAYTVWILLFVIWVYISSIHRKTILGGSKIGSSKNRNERKKKLSAAAVIVIAVQVILGVGNLCFAFAVSFGIFWC